MSFGENLANTMRTSGISALAIGGILVVGLVGYRFFKKEETTIVEWKGGRRTRKSKSGNRKTKRSS